MTLALVLALTGCAGPSTPNALTSPTASVSPSSAVAPSTDPRQAACEGQPLGAPRPMSPPLPVHGTVVEVVIEGLGRLEERDLRKDLRARPGKLALSVVAEDIRRLFAHDAIADVTVIAEPSHEYRDDLRLVYRVTERPAVGQIFLSGDEAVARDLARRIEGHELVEPRRVHRFTHEVLDRLHQRGHRDAALHVTVHSGATGALDLCVHAEPGPVTTVKRWVIRGVTSLPESVLAPIYAHASIGKEGAVLDDEALALALLHLQAAYWNHGYLESTIGEPSISSVGDDQLQVAIEVTEGPIYRYGKVRVDGHAKAAYPRFIAPLRTGAVFQRSAVMGVVEALREYHQSEKLDVDVHTHLDKQAHTVDLELVMVPPGTGAIPAP